MYTREVFALQWKYKTRAFPGISLQELIIMQNYDSIRRRKWQPTPVFPPGKSLGQRSLVGYSPWGCKESDMPEQLSTHNYTRFPQIIWRKLPMIIMMDIDAQLISLLRLP